MIAELYLAQRYLFRGRARHISFIGIIACLGIALGVGTLIVVISVMNGFDQQLSERLLRFNPHLMVESVEPEILGLVKDDLSRFPEVENASLFLQTQVFGKFDDLVLPLVVKGMDFSDPKTKDNFQQYIVKDREGEGFFIGQGLNERFLIGDKLEFYPLKKDLKLQTERIRGVFNIGLYDIDNNYLIADLDLAKSLSKNYLLFLGVRIDDPFKASEVKQKILKEYPTGVFVITWTESNKALFSALELEKITMFVILSLIILVAAFNIFATLSIKVVEKTKDIGILKTLGFTKSKVKNIFTFQGLLLGVFGSLSGAGLGLLLCYLLEEYKFIKLPQEIYFIESLPVAINYPDTLIIVSVGIVLSYIFSLLPATRAARLLPSDALRYE